jgi:hypothetical protein
LGKIFKNRRAAVKKAWDDVKKGKVDWFEDTFVPNRVDVPHALHGMFAPGASLRLRCLIKLNVKTEADLVKLLRNPGEDIPGNGKKHQKKKAFELWYLKQDGTFPSQPGKVSYDAVEAYLTPYAMKMVKRCLLGNYLEEAGNEDGWMRISNLPFSRTWLKGKQFTRIWPRADPDDGIECGLYGIAEFAVVDKDYFKNMKNGEVIGGLTEQIFSDRLGAKVESFRQFKAVAPFKVPPGALDPDLEPAHDPPQPIAHHAPAKLYLCHAFSILSSMAYKAPHMKLELALAELAVVRLDSSDCHFIRNARQAIEKATGLQIRNRVTRDFDPLAPCCSMCDVDRASCQCLPVILSCKTHSFAIYKNFVFDANVSYVLSLSKESLDVLAGGKFTKADSAFAITDIKGSVNKAIDRVTQLRAFEWPKTEVRKRIIKVDELETEKKNRVHQGRRLVSSLGWCQDLEQGIAIHRL